MSEPTPPSDPQRPRELGVDSQHMRAAIERRLFASDALVKVGRYELIEPIGRGGMGTVYRAHDPALGRDVAVKVLHGGAGGSERASLLARLVREARLLARLSHPNVVAVHDVGEHDDTVFIAMEYVRGETLRAWLEREPIGPRRLAAGLGLLVGVGRGLAAAHAIGLVHRDVKPENVLIGTDHAAAGTVRVVDFGLAKGQLESEPSIVSTTSASATSITTASGQLAGTPAYMAPEQLERGVVGPAADQYAFCLMLFELAFGRRPFAASSVRELATIVTSTDVTLPAAPRLPAALGRILARGLQRDPAARHADMNALLDELERVRRGRRHAVALALVGAGALAGAVPVFALMQSHDAPPCNEVAARLDEHWSPAAAEAVRAAFSATDRGHAGGSADAVVAALDDWAARWRAARLAACTAGLVDRTESTVVMDRKVACLERSLRDVAAQLEIWRDADGTVVDRAQIDAGRLPGVDHCAAVDVLATIAPIPDDDATRADVERVEAATARVAALVSAGRREGAAEELAAVDEAAPALQHDPTASRWLASRAVLELARGEIGPAEATTKQAFARALRGGDDRAAARAAVMMARVAAVNLQDPPTAIEWADLADALTQRVGGDSGLTADAAIARGLALARLDRQQDAEVELARAVELHRRDGREALAIRATSDLASAYAERGELRRALAMYRRTIAETRELHGAGHPDEAHDMVAIGIILGRLGEGEEAERVLKEALALEERIGSPLRLGYVLAALGNTLQVRGAYAEAIPIAERSVAEYRLALGDEAPLTIQSRRVLAIACMLNGDHARGIDELEASLALARKHEPPVTLALSIAGAGGLLLKANRNERARQLVEEAAATIVTLPEASKSDVYFVLAHQARTYRLIDDPRAVAVATQVVELMRSDPERDPARLAVALYDRALALEQAHRRRSARADAEQAIAELRAHGEARPGQLQEIEQWLAEH